jgi:hypothetical protein
MYTSLLRIKPIACVIYTLTILGLLLGGSPAARAEPGDRQPAPSAQRSLYLPLVARPGAAPTSDELIDAALERGEIDAETALIYHVFVAFADPRLPARFRGDDSQPSDRELAGQLAERFNQLSPQAKATLEPFLIPPYHTGSWWDLRQQQSRAAAPAISPAELRCGRFGNEKDPLFNQWHYVDSANGLARIWWQARFPGDEAKARDFATAIDGIWLKLAALMRRQPLSDQGETTTCRGGDNRLDISLIDLGNNGEAWPYTFDPVATPSYILINRDAGVATLAHELMHSFQFAYDVAGTFVEYSWWREATGAWAEHYVYPTPNSEHRFAHRFLGVPELPLEFYHYNQANQQEYGNQHQYGAYLLPLFQQIQTGQPDFARTSWEQFELYTNSVAAINSLLPGGFMKQWPEFTLRNVNKPPVDDYFKVDKLPNEARLKLNQLVTLQGAPSVAYTLDGNVQHLAAHYFRFAFTDATVRSVLFENPFADGLSPTAHVRALYRIDTNEWATEDWTDKPYATFCRDVRMDRVKELYIVISNSEWSNRSHKLAPANAPRLQATNVACRGWKVDAQFTYTHEGPTWKKTSIITTTATLERMIPSSGRYHTEFYKITGGTAQWSHAGHMGNCAGSKSGSYDVVNPLVEHSMIVETYNISYLPPFTSGTRKYHAVGARPGGTPFPTVTYVCPNQTYTEPANVEMWLQTAWEVPLMRHAVNADGRTLQGSSRYTSNPPVGTTTFTSQWKMTALPPE